MLIPEKSQQFFWRRKNLQILADCQGQGEFKGKFWIELQQHDDWPRAEGILSSGAAGKWFYSSRSIGVSLLYMDVPAGYLT